MGKIMIHGQDYSGVRVGGYPEAKDQIYDNTNNSCVTEATTVQGAIDELGSVIDATNSTIDELKKSVSDGKTLVADAITAKGVETATDATFATMAANIEKIIATAESNGNLVTKLTKSIDVSSTGVTFIEVDITEYDNYQNITIDNIFVQFDTLSSYPGSNPTLSYSYESTTGIFTITSNTTNSPFRSDSNNTLDFTIIIVEGITEESSANSNIDYIAPEYSTESTYYEGDYVTYDGAMYECLEDSVTGEFDSTKWERTYLSESSLKEEVVVAQEKEFKVLLYAGSDGTSIIKKLDLSTISNISLNITKISINNVYLDLYSTDVENVTVNDSFSAPLVKRFSTTSSTSIDVSSYTGEYYIGFYIGGSAGKAIVNVTLS